MNVFEEERQAIAGKLTAAGVANVTLDPRGALPCCLVDLPEITGLEGIGGWSAVYTVKLIVAPPGDLDALGWLLDQLEPVLVTFPAPAEPTTVDHGGKECPSYVVTLNRSIANPNC